MKKKQTSIKINKDVERDVYKALGLAFILIFVFFIIPFMFALIIFKVYADFPVSWLQIGLNGIVLVLGLIMVILGRKRNDRKR